jgi:hypothetical protein
MHRAVLVLNPDNQALHGPHFGVVDTEALGRGTRFPKLQVLTGALSRSTCGASASAIALSSAAGSPSSVGFDGITLVLAVVRSLS